MKLCGTFQFGNLLFFHSLFFFSKKGHFFTSSPVFYLANVVQQRGTRDHFSVEGISRSDLWQAPAPLFHASLLLTHITFYSGLQGLCRRRHRCHKHANQRCQKRQRKVFFKKLLHSFTFPVTSCDSVRPSCTASNATTRRQSSRTSTSSPRSLLSWKSPSPPLR